MCWPERWIDRRGRPPALARSAVRTRWRRLAKRESFALLLLLPFLAEDILAGILDALALIGLRLAPATDLGGNLADLLLVDARDVHGHGIGRHDGDAFRDREIHVVAVAELQLQVLALNRGAVADAGDLERLGEALGHAGDEVLHQGPLHAPEGARALGIMGGLDRDVAVLDRVAHFGDHIDREGALRPLHRKLA